jgi:hypothetical protein
MERSYAEQSFLASSGFIPALRSLQKTCKGLKLCCSLLRTFLSFMPLSSRAKARLGPINATPMPEHDSPPIEAGCPKRTTALPWTVAAPSWVVPGPVGKNCTRLAGLVDEVAILFLETRSCLAYTPDDLPPSLAGLGLGFHIHLPSDTDWSRGLDPCWRELEALVRLAGPLSPRSFVLHPPPAGLLAPLAERFAGLGVAPGRVLLENVRGNDLAALLPEALGSGFNLCLDLGHQLAYSQHALEPERVPWERVGMVHAYAPGPGGRHLGLERLDLAGMDLLRRTLTRLGRQATLTLEVFDLDQLTRSLERVQTWWRRWNADESP